MPKNKPAHPKVTREVFQDYHTLQQRGVVNMLDLNAVYTAAKRAGMEALADLAAYDYPAYLDIIQRHKFYADKYQKE